MRKSYDNPDAPTIIRNRETKSAIGLLVIAVLISNLLSSQFDQNQQPRNALSFGSNSQMEIIEGIPVGNLTLPKILAQK